MDTTKRIPGRMVSVVASSILVLVHCYASLCICLPIPSQSFTSSAVAQRTQRQFKTFMSIPSSSSDNDKAGGGIATNRSKIRIGFPQAGGGSADNPQRRQATGRRKSMISSIRCRNLAGIFNGKSETADEASEIVLHLDDGHLLDGGSSCNLVAVTGETGSGKSLLVSKIVDLATGGKATTSLLQGANSNAKVDPGAERNGASETQAFTATAEIMLSLYDPAHVSMLTKMLHKLDLDAGTILGREVKGEDEKADFTSIPDDSAGVTVVRLKRSFSLSGQRVKSACFINDHPVPLKAMRAVGAPMVAIVDAPAAAAALGRAPSRLSMVDAGLPPTVLAWVRQLQTAYRKAKTHRESLQKELARQTLPISMLRDRGGTLNDRGVDDRDLELLRHWIDELDGFEGRISNLQGSLCSSVGLAGGVDDISEMALLLEDAGNVVWMANEGADDPSKSFSSTLYRTLLDLLDLLKALDAHIKAAEEAREALASLSAPDSAQTALERTRQLLMDATMGGAASPKSKSKLKSRTGVALEKAHQLLNQVEDALLECATFLDDDDRGPLATLQATRRACPVSAEELFEYITEWNTLARKHGIPPYQLPSCHATLKKELDGGVEARILLPKAQEAERNALKDLEVGCRVLTDARNTLCQRLSRSVTSRLPLLGMENSRFEAVLRPIARPSYSASHLGEDEVDFYLLHDRGTGQGQSAGSNGNESTNEKSRSRPQSPHVGGRVESVASSGEKARIVLAIECEIPGSVRILCGTPAGDDSGHDQDWSVPPVAVIYDEIDAHVGGRASTSVAQMLSDQSRACQVFSITHSASLAAIADTHIRIQRGPSSPSLGGGGGGRIALSADHVTGVERRREVARMASGDMAVEEAEVFAEALLRDAKAKAGRQDL